MPHANVKKTQRLDPRGPLVFDIRTLGPASARSYTRTVPAPANIDWLCVSPKAEAELRILSGDELKLVFPQSSAPPEAFDHLSFRRFSLQPMDGPDLKANTAAAIAYCFANPKWNLSMQTHKYLGIR